MTPNQKPCNLGQLIHLLWGLVSNMEMTLLSILHGGYLINCKQSAWHIADLQWMLTAITTNLKFLTLVTSEIPYQLHGEVWPIKTTKKQRDDRLSLPTAPRIKPVSEVRNLYSRCDPQRASQAARVEKNPPANGDRRDTGLDSRLRKVPWRRARQPTLAFWPGESRGQRSLAVYSPCGLKGSDTTEAA